MDIWKTGTTKSIDIMALVCMLYFCTARYNINITLPVSTVLLLMLPFTFRTPFSNKPYMQHPCQVSFLHGHPSPQPLTVIRSCCIPSLLDIPDWLKSFQQFVINLYTCHPYITVDVALLLLLNNTQSFPQNN